MSQGSVGIGFAIPINRARRIAEELKQSGRIDRSFATGLEIQTLDKRVANLLDLPFAKGVLITKIDDGSAADDAGLKPGDVILTLNGFKVNKSADVFQVFSDNELRAGDEVNMTVYTNGENKEITFKLRKS